MIQPTGRAVADAESAEILTDLHAQVRHDLGLEGPDLEPLDAHRVTIEVAARLFDRLARSAGTRPLLPVGDE